MNDLPLAYQYNLTRFATSNAHIYSRRVNSTHASVRIESQRHIKGATCNQVEELAHRTQTSRAKKLRVIGSYVCFALYIYKYMFIVIILYVLCDFGYYTERLYRFHSIILIVRSKFSLYSQNINISWRNPNERTHIIGLQELSVELSQTYQHNVYWRSTQGGQTARLRYGENSYL